MALTTIKTGAIADDAVTADKVANAINTSIATNTAKDLTALSASNLTSGTVPDARFPATLPAASATNLTAVPAANITGTLPAISGANLTGISTTPADGSITQAKLNFPVANRNLIINGAMQVAQRGTSASVTGGYLTLDRFETATGGVDEAPTQAQVDVASGTTPYTLGFRKALKVTNGNQTSGAGTSDNIIALRYHAEAQDIANSGWNYTSSSSNLTLQFWIKSSVAQSFQGVLVSDDGTKQIYPFATGSLSADTWTKITKTISGNSNLTFNNDNGKGLTLEIIGFSGSDFATDSATINAWQARTSGNQFGRASTSTWYTTNDATLEITGVQLEVGSVATDFEHRSYSDEFQKCERYYQDWKDYTHAAHKGLDSSYDGHIIIDTLKINMRANPTITGTVYGWVADGTSWIDGSNGEAASLHNDPSSDFPGRYVKVTGVWNWNSNYQSTIAVKFVVAKFDAEL